MGRERFKEGKRDSFFGSFVYEQAAPKDHFLVKLNEVVPWQRITYKLGKYYRGKAKEGRPPYDLALLLKMLLVSYLYDISERQTEEVANLNLAVDEAPKLLHPPQTSPERRSNCPADDTSIPYCSFFHTLRLRTCWWSTDSV